MVDDNAVEAEESRDAISQMFGPRDAVEEFGDAVSEFNLGEFEDDDDARASAEIDLADKADAAIEEMASELKDFADRMAAKHNDVESALPRCEDLTPEAGERFDRIRDRLFDLEVSIKGAQ